ncbi:MAG: tetratricopeptide repeat protein [Xanthobacteraceae bacterium]
MTLPRAHRIALFGATALIGLALAAGPAFADMKEDPAPPPPSSGDKKKDDKKTNTPSTGTGQESQEKKDKQSERQFLDGYKLAYQLIKTEKYQAGIAAMHALGQDDHPDVATSIGFSWRKLGDYDKAKVWYDKALAADPGHIVTLSYYGMWHAEQGNVLKAEDFLQKIASLCGNKTCEPYKNLDGVIDGRFTY